MFCLSICCSSGSVFLYFECVTLSLGLCFWMGVCVWRHLDAVASEHHPFSASIRFSWHCVAVDAGWKITWGLYLGLCTSWFCVIFGLL